MLESVFKKECGMMNDECGIKDFGFLIHHSSLRIPHFF